MKQLTLGIVLFFIIYKVKNMKMMANKTKKVYDYTFLVPVLDQPVEMSIF